MSKGDKLTVSGHLGELRQRLIRSVIALVITTIVCFIFAKQIFDVLTAPAGDTTLIYTAPTEMLGTYMKVSLAGGFVLAMPFLLYQLLMFIAPGLTGKEKRYLFLVLPWMALMFMGGIAFGYYIMLPPAMKFLFTFGSDIATPFIKIGNYISVVTRLLLAIGLVFETPVIILFLARIGLVTPKTLARKRKHAIIGSFILAAIITPTFDPINQTLVAGPLIILYEISIWLAKLVYRKKPQTAPPTAPTVSEP